VVKLITLWIRPQKSPLAPTGTIAHPRGIAMFVGGMGPFCSVEPISSNSEGTFMLAQRPCDSNRNHIPQLK